MPSLALLLLAAFAQGAAAAPSPKRIDELVERYLALDARADAGFAEQRAILAELESVPALTAAQEKTWRERLLKLAAKNGRKLEEDSGAHWFWPADKKGGEGRGLYIVGGNTKRPKGLLIGLHGGGSGSGDAWSAHGPMNSAASELGWLAIFPEVLVKSERGWTDHGTEEFVLDLVEAALRTWKIDRDRVYFAGHSMGGFGTWTLGGHHADLVAGLAPSAGALTVVYDSSGKASDVDWGVIPNLRNVRVRIYQSDDDPRVPPVSNRIAAKRLEEARERWGGFDFEYWEVPGRGHDEAPGGFAALLAKIADAERDARPAKLVWQPALAWKRQFHWLAWDAPKKFAIVEAEIDAAKNEVRVSCDADAAGLSVLLDDALVDLDRAVVVTLGGKAVHRGEPARSLATLVRTAARGDPALTFAARVPLAP
jgi:pimeloyl-ACP methyl ester carboxylesterase